MRPTKAMLDGMTPEHRRIAQLEAELAEARAAFERAAIAEGETIVSRDAAQARADKAEADAAAMRLALEVTHPRDAHRGMSSCRICQAIDGTAGRALAARVTLLETAVKAGRRVHPIVIPVRLHAKEWPCGPCADCEWFDALTALDEVDHAG